MVSELPDRANDLMRASTWDCDNPSEPPEGASTFSSAVAPAFHCTYFPPSGAGNCWFVARSARAIAAPEARANGFVPATTLPSTSDCDNPPVAPGTSTSISAPSCDAVTPAPLKLS